jgi:EAL domain-containing protein (putative c-di-GMP-specific phosphodiesterase class I)
VLERLRAADVVLAIDDFGTGYSSLAYLRHLPVRILKIDKALLDGVGSDPRATTLVRAVLGVARALGLLVVAEGLEDLATARLLRDLGAWAGQGFVLSPALSATDMLMLLEESAVDLDALRTRSLRVVADSDWVADPPPDPASVTRPGSARVAGERITRPRRGG